MSKFKIEWDTCTTWVNCFICCKPLDQGSSRPWRHTAGNVLYRACRNRKGYSTRPPIPTDEWEANR